SRSGVRLGHHAKQIVARVLKHHKVGAGRTPPRVARRAELQQPVYLGFLVGGIEIEMDPAPAAWVTVSRPKGEVRPFTARVTQDHPAAPCGFPRYIVKSDLPEGDSAIEVVTMDNDGPNFHCGTTSRPRAE